MVHVMRQHAAERPDEPAVIFLADGEAEAGRLTYAQLDMRARAVAGELRARGAADGRVLVAYPSSLEYVVAFLGCLYAGAVAVPCDAPYRRAGLERLALIAKDARPALVLGPDPMDEQVLATLGGRGAVPVLDVVGVPDEAAAGWGAALPNPDALALLQYTSGSTRDPRGVMISHGNVMANEHSIAVAMGHDTGSSIAGWLPIHHDMGLFGNLLQPWYLGACSVFMPPMAFLKKPVRWLRAISRYRCPTSGGPNFAYDLCVARIPPDDRADLDLSGWRVAYNGAEVVRPATLRRFAAAFGPVGFRPEAAFPCYGLAEATLIVTGATRAGPPTVVHADPVAMRDGLLADAPPDGPGRWLAASGPPVAGCTVAVVDPETATPCPPESVGEVWVAGASVARGYWDRPADTAATFGARLAGADGPLFLRTGDLGCYRAGELVVAGRIKDLIVLRGQNHYPHDLEWVAEASHRTLRPTCGAAFTIEVDDEERLVIAYEVDRGRDVDVDVVARAVRAGISDQHGLDVYAVALVKTGGVPKTTSGKIRRRACRDAFVAGRLPLVGVSWREPAGGPGGLTGLPDPAELIALDDADRPLALAVAMLHAAAARYGIAAGTLRVTDSLRVLGLDSLAAAELRHALQDRYGIPVAPLSEHTFLQVAAELCGGLAGVAEIGRP